MSEFLDEMRKIREAKKLQNKLKRMRVRKDGIAETVKTEHGIYGKLVEHPALVGCKTAGDILKKVISLYNQVQEPLKVSKTDIESMDWFHKWHFSYKMTFGNGVKGLPTQKNSLGSSGKGKKFHNNPDVTRLRDDIEHQWGMQHDWDFPKLKYIGIDITVYFPTKRESDTDGKITSILDALKSRCIIHDDHYKNIGPIQARPRYRQGYSGFDLTIYQFEQSYYEEMVGINENS